MKVYNDKSSKKSKRFDPLRNGLNVLNDLNVLNSGNTRSCYIRLDDRER